MDNKLARWSWKLSLIGFLVIFVAFILMVIGVFDFANSGGYENSWGLAPFGILLSVSLFVLPIFLVGLIFSIIGLIKVSKNPGVVGKRDAIIGLVINGLVLIFAGIPLFS